MVFQDVVLFDDTVMENIRLGKHGATDEEVLAVIKKQVKTRKDSMLEFQKYQRDDEVAKLQQEITKKLLLKNQNQLSL